ncbi:C45 family autoproteolytic acyltransferase/hydrolase [Parapedobacter deserti]|uniref:C45 family autoproteolytic acyltransferase/hydrolase n=1 Tax=Parapedobacter deserti TaxID=1912957 RepID=A0ABV7JQ30_9SPHI
MATSFPYRFCLRFIGWSVALSVTSCAGVKHHPSVAPYNDQVGERDEPSADYYVMPYGKLRKNDLGLWELYVEGDALQRGLTNGLLTKELLFKQESAFVSQIREFVPSPFRQWLLRGFLNFFNRRLADHVPTEYQAEIYGLSQAASATFNFVAPPYPRLLYYHGAHDIGHALQDLALVGCTSFAAWGSHTADGKLLIGRNFDFYAGDAFAREKIVAFINPDEGYKHAMVTWAGMVGAVSGMNEKGLTVTINAGKSNMPYQAKTPVALLTREILQYAATIDEAIRLAERREVFVSEAIMVGSAIDSKAVLIEVSPKKFGVYEVKNSSNALVCANHFQSEPYRSDKKNLRQVAESHSQYRFDRMQELLDSTPRLNPSSAAQILRNREGIGGKQLGYGNEKAINQLLAHHAVIFQPEDRLLWVSTAPYQLGAFVAYDLNTVFSRMDTLSADGVVDETRLRIPADTFRYSAAFSDYEAYRRQKRVLEKAVAAGTPLDTEVLRSFEQLNPAFWKTGYLLGEYYLRQGQYSEALRYYRMAADNEVTTLPDRQMIQKRIKKVERKL